MTSANGHAGRKPELLSPAGSAESFFAAIENGADAVYAGLRAFSARSRAANFSVDEMGRMAALCRREGRRLYVTLNTLLKERELPEIVPLLAALAEARVDALIIQDLGLARIVSGHFPSLPLHASTQMTIHSIDGVRQAASLGFRRVVLARELSLPEIRTIAASSPAEIECFVHGALCFSISGQCLFSSFLGGRSGNRGDCAQPCRRRFRLEGGGDYPFSTRDLHGIDAVRELAAAGVASLKIEGRMKPPGYVAAVTAAYRLMIDAPPEGEAEARKEAMSILARARGRSGTAGFLVEGMAGNITESASPGAVGQPLGRVENAGSGSITFVPSERFHAGDRLRVQPGNGREGRTFTVRGILSGGRQRTVGMPGDRVTVAVPFRFTTGDAIHKVDSGATSRTSEAACLRRLAAVAPDRISCNVTLALDGETLSVSGATDDLTFGMDFHVGPLDAARGGSVDDVLRARFSETGDSSFALAGFDASRFPGRFIPPSRLKEIRRSFYEAFAKVAIARREASRAELEKSALASLESGKRMALRVPARLWVGLESADDIGAVDREGVDGFMLTLREAAIAELPALVPRLAALRDRIVWRLPFWLPDGRSKTVAGAVEALLAAGFRRFEANNPAHFRILGGKGASLVAGWRMGAMNGASLRSLHEQGASAAVLSPEDDGVNIGALASADLPIARWVTLFGRVPLMVSRIPVPRAAERTSLAAEGGETFDLAAEDGLTVVASVRPASLTAHRERLEAEGIEVFVVELPGTPRNAWAEVLDAACSGIPLTGASSFNFEREARP